MSDLIIGTGNLAGKGVYANRDFRKGEVVTYYNIRQITKEEYKKLQSLALSVVEVLALSEVEM